MKPATDSTVPESVNGEVFQSIFDKGEDAWYAELSKLPVREIAALHIWASALPREAESEEEERLGSFLTACEDAATARCLGHWMGAGQARTEV